MMRSRTILYCRGHKLWEACLLTAIVMFAVYGAGSTVVNIPWLSGLHAVTLNGVVGTVYALNVVLIFRNEISRLEHGSPYSWKWVNGVIFIVLWGLPWMTALGADDGARFAYIATVTLGLCIGIGGFVRTDTLMLLLIAQFLVQTIVWQSLESTPWRHLLFVIDELPLHITLVVSFVALIVSFFLLGRFQQREDENQKV